MALETDILRTDYPIDTDRLEYTRIYGNINQGRSYLGDLVASSQGKPQSQLQELQMQKGQLFNLYIKGQDYRRDYLVDANHLYHNKFDGMKRRPALSSKKFNEVPMINILDSTHQAKENKLLNEKIFKNRNKYYYSPQRVFNNLNNVL
jgi:hypothetical protein